MFPDVRTELSLFLFLWLGITKKSQAPSCSNPPFRYLYISMTSPWDFSSSGYKAPALFAFPYIWRCSSLLTNLVAPPVCPGLFLVWGMQSWTLLRVWHLLHLLQCSISCTRGNHWPVFLQGHLAGSCSNWCSPGPAGPLLQSCWVSPSTIWKVPRVVPS